MLDVEFELSLADYAETDLALENLDGEYWATIVVAGLQYYSYGRPDDLAPNGFVIPVAGDRVLLEREPDNAADRNAIKVTWRNSFMLGHVPRGVAAVLAGPMDGGRGVRGYVVDPGAGGAWQMRILLVGPAVERLHGERLEARPAEIEAVARCAAQTTWPETEIEREYGEDAPLSQPSWFGHGTRRRRVRIVEPAAPRPTAAQRDAAWRFESGVEGRLARRRADATLALAARIDLYEPLPDGADVAPDQALRGHVFGWWSEVPAWLMTKTSLKKYGLRPGHGVKPFARIEYSCRGGRDWRAYDLYAVNATAPLKTTPAGVLAAAVERQAHDEMAVIL